MPDQNEKIRVLIADDVMETREILEKSLYFEKDVEVVGKAANGREALLMAKQFHPDIVLMDINMPEMDGIAATEAIIAQVPGTQIIMLSVQDEQEYLRRAMLAGAREYLIKPPDPDELIRSLRHVARLQPTTRGMVNQSENDGARGERGKVIAVFGPKGGVGCSAIASNLAVALRQLTGKRVALVDGNITFGDVGVAMNLVANKTILDLATRVGDIDEQLIKDVTMEHASGVRVLLAPQDSQSGEAILPDQVRGVIEALRPSFDFIVVDTPTSYDDRTLTMLDTADRIVVLMTLELMAIKNVKQFLELAGPLGYPDNKLILVLNKADSRFGIRVDSIESQLRHKVDIQIVNAPLEMTLSLNQGVPIVVDRRTHPVARNILSLAAMIGQAFIPANQSADGAKQAEATPTAPTTPAAPKTKSRGMFARFVTKR